MSGVKLEVQWSPIHNNKFITWGTEIYLYETLPRKDYVKSSCVELSETTVAHLLATNSHHHYVKCVDIYPKKESDILLAIGQANGKVTLTTFGPTVFDSLGLTGQELSPKHARQCNSVAWNPVDSNLIAVALDRFRAEHSVILWDVLKGPSRLGHHTAGTPTEYSRPVAELGLSDTAHSLAWLHSQPRSLVIGMNNKHLKMVDLRDPSKAVNSAPTKAVYGITVAPFNDNQLASFIENQIAIWDTRSFEKPILTLPQAKPVLKIIWCPTRHNLLGSLQRESSGINLHDIQQSVDDADPSVLERSVQPGSDSQLTSFSWHPQDENRLLTIAITGAMVDYCVFERMTLNWSPSSHIVWTHGRRTLKLISHKDKVYSDIKDISTLIRRRAIGEYGLKSELWQNGELAEDNSLKKLWQWLHLSYMLVEDGVLEAAGTHHPGVRCVLGMDANNTIANKSELVCLPWSDLPGSTASIKIYRSEDRDKCLQLCGWRFDKESNALTSFLDRLQVEGEYSRAAAISVFNLRLRFAIDILNNGAKAQNASNKAHSVDPANTNLSHLNIVAMALSGYSEDKNSMWRELCVSSRSLLTDPYLRATFAFLTSDSESYEAVLSEGGMAVEDQVAFACTFLSNKRLSDYLTELNDRLTEQGNLAGILLTGGGSAGIPLLQRYLDASGDVQSVSVIASRAFPTELIENDPTVSEWITSYRSLLDSWRLWSHRAHFDIALNTRNLNNKPAQQIFVACNFCAKSISAYMQGLARNRGPFARLGTTSNRLKISSCPNCRKPQPRCAICLVNMGTPSCYGGSRSPQSGSLSSSITNSPLKLSEFSSWFTWCQTCRHGGHASHMSQWFREHSECPVTACSCRCLSIDSANKIPAAASSM
ncbi:GATOR complex protein mio isoform X2 [Lycorma delicatula]|uniref:GATOR complex protein mio isoform X2 n=1 Tax=Lycorma delicatula TaxID=130591 RepID=UPI003F5158AF